MIVYNKLIGRLNDRHITFYQLRHTYRLQNSTLARLKSNKPVNISTINVLCRILRCQPGDILEYQED